MSFQMAYFLLQNRKRRYYEEQANIGLTVFMKTLRYTVFLKISSIPQKKESHRLGTT